MTPACKHCHWYRSNPIGASCQHPDAESHDRVRGAVFPVLEHILTANPPNREKALADCDREGRFEPIRHWWNFWRAA